MVGAGVAEQVSIRVPVRHRAALQALAAVDGSTGTSLVDVIQRVPEPVSVTALEEEFRRAGLPADTGELLTALMSMERTRASHGWDVADLAKAVASSSELNVPEDRRSAFSELLLAILGQPVLRRAAKARGLARAHERILHTSRVLTDWRPVYDDDVSAVPPAAVLVHQLELTVHSSVGETQVIYVSLGDDDLGKLRSDIDRALSKSTSLQGFAELTGVPLYLFGAGS